MIRRNWPTAAAPGASRIALGLFLAAAWHGGATAQAVMPTGPAHAVSLCGDFVHGRYLTPSEAAEAAVDAGYSRATNLTQTEDYMTGYEVVGLRSSGVQLHLKVYDMPAGRRTRCVLFLTGVDDAGHRALLAEYVEREPSDFSDWTEWRRTTGSTYVKWERVNDWTGSTLSVLTIAQGAQTLTFSRDDPPGLPLDEFFEDYW